MNNPCRREFRVAIWKRYLAKDGCVSRVPEYLQCRMIEGGQQATSFSARADITGLLVLQGDYQTPFGRSVGEVLKRRNNAFQALLRCGRAPVRKHANDLRAGQFGNFEG